jgi:hypothetical protein
MEKIPLDVLFDCAEYLENYTLHSDTGERWSVLTLQSKKDILSFRSVSRGFRDASWTAYARVLAQKPFSMTCSDFEVLYNISQHYRLHSIIRTITFGGQKYSLAELRRLNVLLESHPKYSTFAAITDEENSWQLGLTNLIDFDLSELRAYRDKYAKCLEDQEAFWNGGLECHVGMLQEALQSFSNLQSVRIHPHQNRRTFGKAPCNFNSNLSSLLTARDDSWTDVSRSISALSKSTVPFMDLRMSVTSNFGLAPGSPFFQITTLDNLRILKISLIEEELIADEVYRDHAHSGHDLTTFLEKTPNLRTLDICMKPSNRINYRSYILAHLSRASPCYHLEHLCLESALMSQDDFARMFKAHASTLTRLVLLLPWLRPGRWSDLLDSMATEGAHLNYLELWKPSQGAVHYYDNQDWIPFRELARVSKEGRVVKFHGEVDDDGEFLDGSGNWSESWDNYYPHRSGR